MSEPKRFPGFSNAKTRFTSVPDSFFFELLPLIDDLAELKLTLHIWWWLGRKEGNLRYISASELAADEALASSLNGALNQALARAVARQTLLPARVATAQGDETYYFLNTAKGRAAVAGIARGQWSPSGQPQAPITVLRPQPNIFELYEQNIGALTPLLADELRDAEQQYPTEWLVPAFSMAVQHNARNWRYVRAILERWRVEGRTDDGKNRTDSEADRRRYLDYLN